MSESVRLTPPLDADFVRSLKAGTPVAITGRIYGARDQAHVRLLAALREGGDLPFDPKGAIVYYVGPTPATEGRAVGSAGPTTSARMDAISEPLLEAGVVATIGKGPRSPELKKALQRHGAVYLAATGGAGALLGARIDKAKIIAFDELGCEALRALDVVDFPAIVAVDSQGNDLFEDGPKEYKA